METVLLKGVIYVSTFIFSRFSAIGLIPVICIYPEEKVVGIKVPCHLMRLPFFFTARREQYNNCEVLQTPRGFF